MCDTEDSSAQISVKSEVIEKEEEENVAKDPPEVCIKVETTATEDDASDLSLLRTENNADNVSVVTPSEEIEKSVDNGEDETKVGTEENLNQTPENASLRAKLRALVDGGKHYLQCGASASLEEFERQVSIYKELTEVQLTSFNKELVRSCPIVITDGEEGFIFKVGYLVTSPLEICYTEKFVTHAGCNSEDKKFSFGYKKFGKGLPTREVFNPIIKKSYEAVLKYVHKSGRPFHVLKKKPPGFWSALTIMCNKKKELLLQIEVHVSTNQYKMQSCELEKQKFLNYFTDGPGKDCNVVSLQWKEYVGTVGCMNQVLYGKEFLIERFGDLNLRLYPDDFLFSKPSGVDIVCRILRELLDLQESDPKVTVLEVGTGTGIVGMHLSKVCKRVHMLDRSDKVCTEHAEANVKLNGIPNCFVHHGDTIQSIQKVTTTVSEDDKIYAIIHNNMDTRRVAAEIDCIAANQKIKKIVYLSLDHKVRGIKQIRSLCCPSNDTFVPVKIFPLVIVPCYSDVDLAVLLVRQSLLEGNTAENELRENEDTSVSVDLTDKNKETEDGRNDEDNDNEQSECQEPPNKKRKPWKEQSNGRKGKQKFRKGKLLRLDRWPSDCWQDDDEFQDGADAQGMNIRKVGFPGYKPPSLLGSNKSPKTSKKSHFQQNEKWSKWQQRSQSWGQSQHMNRGFQQSSQNYEDWYPQLNRYQEMNFDNDDTCGYEEDWGEHQQMFSSGGHEPFYNNAQHQFGNSRNQQFNSSYNQQYNSQYSSQNQPYSDSQNRRYSSPQNQQQQQLSSSNNQQQYNRSQNQQQYYSSQNQQQYNGSQEQQQYDGSQNQQQYSGSQNQQQYNGSQNQQQFNTSQNQQHYNNPQNQQFYNNAQLNQFDSFQNQQFNNSQNQQFNSSQNQQFNSSQNQQFNSSQNQQNNTAQNQQFNSAQNQQFNSSQNQQLNSSQNQQFNNSQQKQLQDAQQQQLNSPMQINLNPTGQQMNYEIPAKSVGQQMQHDASVKSGDPQQNYDASEKADVNKQYQQYGVDYSSVQQAQNYGTSSWGGQQSAIYNYGYAGSGSSVVPGFNMSATSNSEQQRSWTPYLPQTKFPTGDTNPN